MSAQTPPPWIPSGLLSPSSSPARHALLTSIIPLLLASIADIGQTLRASHQVSLAGTANTFGDEQLNVDVLAEEAIRAALGRHPAVVTASSEEDPVERAVAHDGDDAAAAGSEDKFTVAFDPLDGSSIIGPNWTVGTIIGIWKGDTALGKRPRDHQIASILGVYGPRTTAVVALREPGQPDACFELGLDDAGRPDRTQLIRSSVHLAAAPYKTRYFAPANLRAAAEEPRYLSLVTRLIASKYTLRYSGGLVPDVVHALVKGHGVYVSPVTAASGAKLRRLYELCPVALVVECAGGRAVDPLDGRDVLDRAILHCDERAGLLCGNRDEVDAAYEGLSS